MFNLLQKREANLNKKILTHFLTKGEGAVITLFKPPLEPLYLSHILDTIWVTHDH